MGTWSTDDPAAVGMPLDSVAAPVFTCAIVGASSGAGIHLLSAGIQTSAAPGIWPEWSMVLI